MLDGGWSVAGRYRDVRLRYRLVGAPEFRTAGPARRIPIDRKHERYEFTIPPYPHGTRGEIELAFSLTLDEERNEFPGYKQIRIE